MFYFYILQSCIDDSLYFGSTNNLKRRFKEHNDGKVKSTKSKVPFKLIYYEAYTQEQLARNREKTVKNNGNSKRQLLKRLGLSN